MKKELLGLGFNAARSDGKDIPFFEAFRIEKGYLTEGHNEAFREFREKRAAEGMPPPDHPGAVAVECYGRQVGREGRAAAPFWCLCTGGGGGGSNILGQRRTER